MASEENIIRRVWHRRRTSSEEYGIGGEHHQKIMASEENIIRRVWHRRRTSSEEYGIGREHHQQSMTSEEHITMEEYADEIVHLTTYTYSVHNYVNKHVFFYNIVVC